METPLKIGFQGSDPSNALSRMITEHVDALERFYGRMTSCHVMVQVPDRPSGGPYRVHVHMALPGGIDLNVDQTPAADERFFDPQFAVSDVFRRAKRLLKDHVSKRRGDVKTLRERIDRTLDRPEE